MRLILIGATIALFGLDPWRPAPSPQNALISAEDRHGPSAGNVASDYDDTPTAKPLQLEYG